MRANIEGLPRGVRVELEVSPSLLEGVLVGGGAVVVLCS